MWQDIAAIEDPELKELVESLPNVVLQSRAPSTIKKYSGTFLRWKRWALSRQADIPMLPATPLHVALYLMSLIQKSTTSVPIEKAVNALSRAHQVAFVEDPTRCNIVKETLAGAKRMLAHRTQKKEPITPEILKNLVDKFASLGASLLNIRVVTICLISFAGFLWFGEMANLKEADIQIFPDHLELFIESSKTDQYRDGAWIIIARSGQSTCPVRMLERYIQLGNREFT